MIDLSKFRPLLAATVETEEDYAKLRYPLLASPKIDGIRVICHPTLGPVTRSLKPVPNEYIREFLSNPDLRYLDGEIVVGPANGPDVFNMTQSAVMTRSGKPQFTYIAFDHIGSPTGHCPFHLRLSETESIVSRWQTKNNSEQVVFLQHTRIADRSYLDTFEELIVSQEFEGVMLRDPSGKYKFNRSTLREGILLKLKRFMDAEAVITGWEPLYRNENEAFTDERGYQKRSAHLAGKIADDNLLGKLHLRGINSHWIGVDFKCGSGLDDATRSKLRKMAADGTLLGRTVTYKFMPYGSKDAPRAPIFKGLRLEVE